MTLRHAWSVWRVRGDSRERRLKGLGVPRLCEPRGILSKHLLFVEAGDPVPWPKPENILYDPTQPARFRDLFRDGFRTDSDGGYRFIRRDADAKLVPA